MSYKVMLAPMAGAPSDLRTLAAASAVVRKFGGHVEALHAAGDPRDSIPFVGEGASGALVEQIVTAAEKASLDGAAQPNVTSIATTPKSTFPSTWIE